MMGLSTAGTGPVSEEEFVAQDPDAIQAEIERTREELARTLDAIADRVSPRRAATRGAQKVKTTVENVFRGGGNGFDGQAMREAPPAEYQGYSGTAAGYSEQPFTGESTYETQVRVRMDRVLIAAGAAAAVVTAIVLIRRRRKR